MSNPDQAQLDYLNDLLKNPVELCDELLEYYEESGPIGPCIRHPLVYSIIHSPMQNRWANESLAKKAEAANRALDGKQWNSYIYLHERPYRIDAFEDIADKMTDTEYWGLLGDVWTDSENIYQNKARWRTALTSPRRGREMMMSEDERRALAEDHDDEIPVFRGYKGDGDPKGFSWTTNSVVAKFFARRLAQSDEEQWMVSGVVKKAKAIAFFDGRSEQEIVCMPEDVQVIETKRLT